MVFFEFRKWTVTAYRNIPFHRKLLKYVNSKFNFAQYKSFVNSKQDPCNKDNFF